MSDKAMREVPLQFGERGRLFGILTHAEILVNDPSVIKVFVILNAGLLHRVGPYRLHVSLARKLAELGFYSLRVDLSGIGDSLPRPELTIQQTVAKDYEDIVAILESQLGSVSIVLVGLCSGADNAIRLVPDDLRIVGMVLLDPVCGEDDGFNSRGMVFKLRAFIRQCMTPSILLPWLRRCVGISVERNESVEDQVDNLAIRYMPTHEETCAAFELIHRRKGRVLSIFTRYALPYYNQAGQLGRVIGVNGYDAFGTEIFWPHADHTYSLDMQRSRLIEEITKWAAESYSKKANAS